MNKRKLLFPLLFLLMLCAFTLMLSLNAGAATTTVSDAASLKNAIANVNDGDVIELSGSFTLSEALTVNTAVTIDGNGHTVSATATKAFVINNDLTLVDANLIGNGSSRLLNVPAGASPTVTVSGSTTLSAGAELPIYSEGSPTIVINGNTAANEVSFSGNHGMYFVGGSPQITVSGKASFDVTKCGFYLLNTNAATLTVNGTDVTVTGSEIGVNVINDSTPSTPTTVSLSGKLTMTMGKYGVEAKTAAAMQLTVSGDVTVNAKYCLVSSTPNAMHMTVEGNTVLKASKNPIHFNEQGDVTRNVRVAGNARLSGEQIVSYGAAVALTVAGNAEIELIEMVFNTRSSSVTVTDNAKITCTRNVRFAPGANNTASFTASGNATVTAKATATYFGIHFSGKGNGRVSISENATVSTVIHTTVAQNEGTYHFEMTGGTLHSQQHSAVWTGDTAVATVRISGGTVLSDNSIAMELKGKAGSTFNIYGGSVISKKGQAAIEARGSVTVNLWGGYYEGSQKCCVRPCESATMNVYGGYYYYCGALNSDGSTVRAGIAADTLSPTVNLYGGTFISTSGNGAVFNAIAPKGNFNIAENAAFSCRGGNAVLISTSGKSNILYKNAVCRYSTTSAPTLVGGAQIRLVENSTGLRFVTDYPKAAIDYLTSIADPDTLSFGTLIIPTDYLDRITHFSLDALLAADLDHLNIKAINGLVENLDGSITVRAAITNIKPENLDRSFTAIGYACYKKSNTSVYFYSNHRQLDHSRSIRQIAKSALEDLSDTMTGKYKYAVGNGTYSRYTSDQRNYMTAHFYDPSVETKKVINLYLIAGQSNAAGYSYFNQSFLQSNAAFSAGYENVLYTGSAVSMLSGIPLSPNTVDVTPVRAGFGYLDSYIGPELGIADVLSRYYTDPNHKAGIIKYAAGSSSLHDKITGASSAGGNWYPPSLIAANGAASEKLTGNLYRLFMDQVENSIKDYRALGYEIHIKGVYWMQGEGDRDHLGEYPAMLRALITDMRNDLGELAGEDLSDMPFVVGEISSSFFRDASTLNTDFVAMQQQLPTLLSDIGNVYVINSSPLSTGTNSGDAGHWTAEDMLLIGQMAGATFAKQVLGQSVADPTQSGTAVAEVLNATGQHLAYYSSLPYAINSAPAGATIKLLTNVTLHSALNISNEKAVTIDGNGFTLTSKSSDHAVRIVAGNVTMNDMRIIHTGSSGAVYGFYLYDSAKLTFNSGYVECEEYNFCLNQASVSLTINGGTFKTRRAADETICNIVIGKAASVAVNGGTFEAAQKGSCISIRAGYSGTVTVSGGSFTTASGKYCLHNPDTGSTLAIPHVENITFSGAAEVDVYNAGSGYKS